MRPWAIVVAALLISVPAFAGVVYEIETTDHDASPPRTESTEAAVEGRNLKMEIAAGGRGGRGEVIYRGDRREMVVVDHDDKSYMVIDEAAIEQIAGQVGAAMGQLQEALKNVPEEQREMVEKMMKERMPAQAPARSPVEVRRTGERGEKNGYPCVEYEVLRDGARLRSLWVTGWDDVEGGAELRAAFEGLAAFGKAMMEAVGGAGGLPGAGSGFADGFFEQMEQIDGFPVVTREYDGSGSLEQEATLRSASRRTLDPADFEPPAGYKRRAMPGG